MLPVALQEEWLTGSAIKVGYVIMESLTPTERARRSARILRTCAARAAHVPAIQRVLDLADSPSRWAEAHAAFREVRMLTLTETKSPTSAAYGALLHLAENVAKTIYNASGLPAPFDHDACWQVVSCARTFAAAIQDADALMLVWHAISDPAAA